MYLRGSLPAYCLLVIWFCRIFGLFVVCEKFFLLDQQIIAFEDVTKPTGSMTFIIDESKENYKEMNTCTRNIVFVGLLFIMNFMVAFGVNVAYVLISISYSAKVITAAQIGLAIFKSSWT